MACNGRAYAKARGKNYVHGSNYKVASCVVCQDSEGRFLITRRKKDKKSWPKAWVFPGGNIEVDEGLDQGALREIFRETGINVKTEIIRGSHDRIYTYNGQSVELTPFFAYDETSSFDVSDHQNPKPPKHAHFVIFFKMQLPARCSEITIKM